MEKTGLSAITLETDEQVTKIYENHCLIGKILLQKPLDQTLVKSFTQREWKCKRSPTVSNINRNMFIFTFQDKEDLVHVLKNRPWTIMGGLLMLSVCISGQVPHEMQLLYSPFWVQAHGLPLDFLTTQNGSKIGAFLGVFVCTDWKVCYNKVSWGKFLRLKVILDVRKPLKTGFWLKRSGFSDIWIDFKYENLGVFCYKCGRIGNSFRTCKFPAGYGKYGPWLRADIWDDPGERIKMVDVKDGGDQDDDCTTLLAVPKAQICESVEFEETPHEDESIPRRNLCRRVICNCIDSTIMSMNCAVIFSRVKFANESEGNWRLLILMAAHLCHVIRKFIRVYRHSGFFKGKDGDGIAISEILISVIFLVILISF